MYLTKRWRAYAAGPGKHLVCNAITGEIHLLGDAAICLLDALRDGEARVPYPSSLLEELKQKRFLFGSQAEEEAAFAAICQKSLQGFRREVPRHYTFVVNSHCNFHCPYCFEAEDFRARVSTLSREQIDAAFRVIDRNASKRTKGATPAIEVFGGEPLLPASRPIVRFLMEQVAARGFTASVQTNGYFLTEYLDLLTTFQTSIGTIQVTLDGPQAVHDARRIPKNGERTFDRIVAGVSALLERDPPFGVNIRMNVDRTNIDYLEAMAEVYSKNGWTRNRRITFTAAPVDNRCGYVRAPEILVGWRELFDRVLPLSSDMGGVYDIAVFKIVGYFRHYFSTIRSEDHPAPVFVPKVLYCEAAALRLLAFHPDGRVYPCPETVGMEPMAIGKYWPRFVLDRHRASAWRQQTIMNRPQCRNCEISTFCGGGCVLTALLRNGSMQVPECEDGPAVLASYFARLEKAAL